MAAAAGRAASREVEKEASDGDDEELEALEDKKELSKEQLLALNPFDTESMPNFSKRRLRYMALFDTERWVDHFAGHTFSTASAAVTYEEGVAVLRTAKEHVLGHKAARTAEGRQQDEVALAALKQKIQSLMQRLQAEVKPASEPTWDGKGFFVRLGPRSPKDAPMLLTPQYGVSKEQLQAAMKSVASEFDEPARNPPEVLHRFQTVATRLMRVTTAEQAINLLVASHRVMQDLSHSMDHAEAETGKWDVALVVRTWDDTVKLEREYRAFVVGGEVTAISQYDDQLYHVEIEENRHEIVAAILREARATRECLQNAGFPVLGSEDAGGKPSSVVVDFLVAPSSSSKGSWEAKIVELNPFGPMTGASLFTWPWDRRLLQGGRDLFGDLEALEKRCPPSERHDVLPKTVREEMIDGVCFRYLTASGSNLRWDYLEALYEDYMCNAPPALVRREG